MAESLAGCLDDLLALMAKARKALINEANTKATLIEPMLSALGWEVSNFAEVEHERPMYDGTHVDYALHVDGKPVAFIEAKPLGANLDAPKAIAQTVNYANQSGVAWCILTDGNRYMLFKSNEHARAPEKLLFEVRLEDANKSEDEKKAVIEKLRRLSKASIGSPDLRDWATAVFLDKSIRLVLDNLLASGNRRLALLVRNHLPNRKTPPKAVEKSLQRLARRALPTTPGEPPVTPPKPTRPSAQHHLKNKPREIVQLFEQLDTRIRALGAQVERRARKYYIAYARKAYFNFSCVKVRRTKLLVYVKLPPSSVAMKGHAFLRDVSKIGHFGTGEVEATLSDPAHLDDVMDLVARAYQETQ